MRGKKTELCAYQIFMFVLLFDVLEISGSRGKEYRVLQDSNPAQFYREVTVLDHHHRIKN